MKVYKLTDRNLRTHKGFQWTIGKEEITSGEGPLCSSGWLHFYLTPELAVLLNAAHANIKDPLIFEAETGEGKILMDNQLKGGSTSLTLIKEIPLPKISLTNRIAFGILCAKEVYKDLEWNLWADNWLKGKNRDKSLAKITYFYSVVSNPNVFRSSSAAACSATYAAAFDFDYATTDVFDYAALAVDDASNCAVTPLDLISISRKALTIN